MNSELTPNILEAIVKTEEIRDGFHYKGTISLGEVVFSYDFLLNESFDKLDQLEDLNAEEMFRTTKINVKIEGQKDFLDIHDEEKAFFFGCAGLAARTLFYSPQRCDLRYPESIGSVGTLGTSVLNTYFKTYSWEDPKVKYGFQMKIEIDKNNPVIVNLLNMAL